MKQVSKTKDGNVDVNVSVNYPSNLTVVLAIPTAGKTTLIERESSDHIKFFDSDDFWSRDVLDLLDKKGSEHKTMYLIGSFISMLNTTINYALDNPSVKVFALTNLWYRDTTSYFRYHYGFLRDGNSIHQLSKVRNKNQAAHKVIDATTANAWAKTANEFYVNVADHVYELESNEYLTDAFDALKLI